MTEASVSVAGNLADDPEVRSTEAGIARARFRVAVSGRRGHEASFFTVIGGRDPAEHVAESRATAAGWSWPRSWAEPVMGDRHPVRATRTASGSTG